MEENVSLFDLIDQFNEDMYIWILDPNTSPQSKRFLLTKLLQNNNATFGTSTGASNDYAFDVQGTPSAYQAGQIFYFISDFTNTGAATVNVKSKGQKNLTDRNGQPLAPGAIQDGSFNIIGYDGTKFQLLVNVGGGDTDITKASIQNNQFSFALDSGVADAYVVDLTPAITAYTQGLFITFKASAANTGASTIDVNGQGATGIVRRDGKPLEEGDIKANSLNIIQYDGTQFQLLVSSGVKAYKLDATTDPGVNNDINDDTNASDGVGFDKTSLWYNQVTSVFWICADNADGAAKWHPFAANNADQSVTHSTFQSLGINFGLARFVSLTLEASIDTLNLTNVTKGFIYFLKIVQDGVGGHTINNFDGTEYTPDGNPAQNELLTGPNEVTMYKIWVAETGNIKIIEAYYNSPQPSGTTEGHVIEDEGTPLTQRGSLNFQGFLVEDDSGNDATKVTPPDNPEGAVNKDAATNVVFGRQGKFTINSTQTNAFHYESDATNAISGVTFSVRTGFATTWEAITFANLVGFLAGTHTTPGESYSVGSTTNWEVRFEASFGASAPSKDFKVIMNLFNTPNT